MMNGSFYSRRIMFGFHYLTTYILPSTMIKLHSVAVMEALNIPQDSCMV